MDKSQFTTQHIIIFAFIFICSVFGLKATNTTGKSVLIITSYNPDTRSPAENISSFVDECKKKNAKLSVSVESMNVQNLSELHLWRGRMKAILSKYENKRPSVVILLGQESWSAFLSQTSSFAHSLPAICGMVSLRTVILPEDTLDVKRWMPVSRDITKEFQQFNIIGGFVNYYDVTQNFNLIKSIYPKKKNLHFISDNSLGGIIMQASVRKYVESYSGMKVDYIDGRVSSFLDVSEKIRSLGEDDCVLVGTWRVDCTENYVLKNTSSTLYEANPNVPAFSLSSSSMGSWAIGGYIPKYRTFGADIADMTIGYLNGEYKNGRTIHLTPNVYQFDNKRLTTLGLDIESLPSNPVFINSEPSLYQKYRNTFYVLLIIFVSLILIIVIAMYYILRINKLKSHLERSAVALKQEKEKAEEANKLKSSFIANMSHEIRTPLNAIVGFSEVLTNEELTADEKQQYCGIINKNSDLLLHLINDVLDISRMESGKIKFEKGECNIVEICRMAVSTVECTKRTKAIFRFHTNKEYFRVKTDPQRVRQVVINLLTNAAKFTAEGEILVDLNVEENKKITIFVQDTGCGIPKDKKDIVFNRFEKLNEFTQGTGLGLSICRLIADNLNGKIWLDTEYTDGAKFIFEIPVE